MSTTQKTKNINYSLDCFVFSDEKETPPPSDFALEDTKHVDPVERTLCGKKRKLGQDFCSTKQQRVHNDLIQDLEMQVESVGLELGFLQEENETLKKKLSKKQNAIDSLVFEKFDLLDQLQEAQEQLQKAEELNQKLKIENLVRASAPTMSTVSRGRTCGDNGGRCRNGTPCMRSGWVHHTSSGRCKDHH